MSLIDWDELNRLSEKTTKRLFGMEERTTHGLSPKARHWIEDRRNEHSMREREDDGMAWLVMKSEIESWPTVGELQDDDIVTVRIELLRAGDGRVTAHVSLPLGDTHALPRVGESGTIHHILGAL